MAPQAPSQHWTLRLEGIPIHTTQDALENKLKSIETPSFVLCEALKTIKIKSCVPKSRKFSCATVVVRSDLPPVKLAQAFNEAYAESEPRLRLDNSYEGVTPLSEDPEGSLIDVIAVHGLNAHPLCTWKAHDSNDVWLQDWLPEEIPKMRVLLYGYDSSLLNSNARSSIETLGSDLLEKVTTFRKDTKSLTRPIIFVGHSLGGLVVKEALVKSLRATKPDPQQIRLSCCGLVFLGVPHWGLRNDCLKTIVEGKPNSRLIESIVVDSESEPSLYLDRLSNEFATCFNAETRILSIYETRTSKTLVKMDSGELATNGEPRLLVTKESATKVGVTGTTVQDIIPFDADHSDLNKFESETNGRYGILRGRLSTMVEEGLRRPVRETDSQRPQPASASVSLSGSTFGGSDRAINGSVINKRGDTTNELVCANYRRYN